MRIAVDGYATPQGNALRMVDDAPTYSGYHDYIIEEQVTCEDGAYWKPVSERFYDFAEACEAMDDLRGIPIIIM